MGEKEHDLYRETKQTQIESLQCDVINIKNQNELWENKVQQLQKEIDALKRKNVDFVHLNDEKMKEINAMSVRLTTLNVEKKSFVEQLRVYKNQSAESKRRMNALENEKHGLLEQIACFKQMIDKLQMTQAQMESKSRQSNANSNVDFGIDLQAILEQSKDKDLQFMTKQNELNKEINTLMIEKSNLQKDKDLITKQLNEATEEMKDYQMKNEQMANKYMILENQFAASQENKKSKLD